MDISQLTRDADFIHSVLQQTADNKLVAKKPLKIYIPSRYDERGLAEIGVQTFILGIFVIVCEGKYAVNNVVAMVPISPSATVKVKIEEQDFYEFSFDQGSVVITSLDLLKNDVLVYKIYKEFIAQGNVPWYLNYNDMASIFDTAKKHANTNVGSNKVVTELIISLITRQKNDLTAYYRTSINSPEDVIKTPPVFIPLQSVEYAATNTTNKLAGSYFNVGVVSALNSPAERVEHIEEILKK
jgi:hypothetical protein